MRRDGDNWIVARTDGAAIYFVPNEETARGVIARELKRFPLHEFALAKASSIFCVDIPEPTERVL